MTYQASLRAMQINLSKYQEMSGQLLHCENLQKKAVADPTRLQSTNATRNFASVFFCTFYRPSPQTGAGNCSTILFLILCAFK